jgi:UDP-N-acetylmuramoyl-L-alanyl-D-glutamate--2,6-diaminopimelate ligase
MLLHDLLRTFNPRISLAQLPNPVVRGVKEDSRHVMPGDLFVARNGTKTDGRAFLPAAQKLGAVAAIVARTDEQCSLPQIESVDPGAAVSRLAHIFYGEPSRAMRVFGITGTNGKTTTAYLLRHLLRKANQPCGLIGTVQIDDGRRTHEAEMTTPSATEIAALLADMRDNGCRACAMEVSSHALDQGRAAGVSFAAAAFTNLTGDHLDYHKSMENYAAAKAKLFEMLEPSAVAVINGGSKWSQRIIEYCRAKIVRFGFERTADYRAENVTITSEGSRFMLVGPDGARPATMDLIGKHNIENALAAAALAGQAFDMPVEQIASGLADAAGAPGRLQAIRAGQNFAVLVDYAHTDDALANVLSALSPLTKRRLRVLFGCGGDRDKTKRARMAAVAEKMADVVYVTSDNPRTEMPLAIITDIVAGFSAHYRGSVVIEPDRRCAIERILADAQSGDVILIAGKGHENYQIVGSTKNHFDDVEEVTRILGARTRAA